MLRSFVNIMAVGVLALAGCTVGGEKPGAVSDAADDDRAIAASESGADGAWEPAPLARIGAGETVEGSFSPRARYVGWTFEADEGETVRLWAAGTDPSDLDTVMMVYAASAAGRPDGFALALNDDYGGSLSSFVEMTAPETQTYVVLVRRYDYGSEGTFAVKLEVTGPVAVELLPTTSNTARGMAWFVPEPGGVALYVSVSGATPGLHGMHIHVGPECGPDGMAAGGHWNPQMHDHALPDHDPRHLGDLGNIEVGPSGEGSLVAWSDVWTIGDGAATDVLGHAIVLHQSTDDGTMPSSGARIACGMIRATTPVPEPEPEPDPEPEPEPEVTDCSTTGCAAGSACTLCDSVWVCVADGATC